jgi:hypothetical protein
LSGDKIRSEVILIETSWTQIIIIFVIFFCVSSFRFSILVSDSRDGQDCLRYGCYTRDSSRLYFERDWSDDRLRSWSFDE